MDRQQALQMARNLMDDYNLQSWNVEISTKFSSALGKCYYRQKTIRLGSIYVETHDLAHVKDTILHEIAHALTPGGHHGPVWMAKAIELGCEPKACASSVSQAYLEHTVEHCESSAARKAKISPIDRILQTNRKVSCVQINDKKQITITLIPGYVFGGSDESVDIVNSIIEAKALLRTIERSLTNE